jgi:hypothetical protein
VTAAAANGLRYPQAVCPMTYQIAITLSGTPSSQAMM